MSYTVLAVVGAAAAVTLDVAVLRTRLVTRRAFWVGYAILVTFQLLSNGILTGRRIVRYDPRTITGFRLAYAPVEDLIFGFALIVTTLSLWVWLGRSRAGHR